MTMLLVTISLVTLAVVAALPKRAEAKVARRKR